MNFKKYSSLENHYNEKMIGVVREYYSEGLWIAREKIHGANFAFYFNGRNLRCASRNNFLQETDSFFSWQIVRDRYEQAIVDVYEFLRVAGSLEMGDELIVYGEIAGTMPSGRSVQREVKYGALDFYAFDFKVKGVYGKETEVDTILGVYGFKVAPVIGAGTFEEVYALKNEFKSVVDPTIEGDNICEGLVLKPNEPKFNERGNRIAIKSKNSKFKEKHESKKSGFEAKEAIKLTETDALYVNTFSLYLHQNRLRNVLSKFGEATKKDFPAIHQLFFDDAMEDFKKDQFIIANGKIDMPDIVHPQTKKMAANLIGKHFKAIITGQF